MRIQICLFLWLNLDSKENGGNKRFSWENKRINIVHSNKENVFMMATHKRNGDYDEYLSLS